MGGECRKGWQRGPCYQELAAPLEGEGGDGETWRKARQVSEYRGAAAAPL